MKAFFISYVNMGEYDKSKNQTLHLIVKLNVRLLSLDDDNRSQSNDPTG